MRWDEDAPAPPVARPRTPWRLIRLGLGYAIAAACLVWIFHDVRGDELLRQFRSIRWGWIGAAIVADTLSYACQGARWWLLLRRLGKGGVSLARVVQGVYAGLFTSEVLPMRAGEVVRAYLASRWMSIGIAPVVSTIVVERFFDGVWLALYIGLAAILVPLPRSILHAADVLGIALLGITLGLGILIFRGGKPSPDGRSLPAPRPPSGLLARVKGWFADAATTVRGMGRTRGFYSSFALTSMILPLQSIAFWFVMAACGLPLPIWAGAVVLLIVYLGTAIPNAPGNVGTYQFFVILGLGLFGVDKTRATGFSLVVFVLLTLPLWAIGSIALARSGMSFRKISEEAARKAHT